MKYLDELRELKKQYETDCTNEAISYVEKITEYCCESLKERAKAGKQNDTVYLDKIIDKSLNFDVLKFLSNPLRDELAKYGIKVIQRRHSLTGIFNYCPKRGDCLDIYWE